MTAIAKHRSGWGFSHAPVDVRYHGAVGAAPLQHLGGAVQMVDVPAVEAGAHPLKVLLPVGREAVVCSPHPGRGGHS